MQPVVYLLLMGDKVYVGETSDWEKRAYEHRVVIAFGAVPVIVRRFSPPSEEDERRHRSMRIRIEERWSMEMRMLGMTVISNTAWDLARKVPKRVRIFFGKKGTHVRFHLRRGIMNPDCLWCKHARGY